MKHILVACAILVLAVSSLILAQEKSVPPELSAFWEKFRMAVIEDDQNQVISLTSFPHFTNNLHSISNETEMKRHYNAIFHGSTNAPECFKKEPQLKLDRYEYFVSCPDAAGSLRIIYKFDHSRTGWKFRAFYDYPPDLIAFLKEFRMAVIKGDQNQVISLTSFPFDYRSKKIKSKTEMKRHYNAIFHGLTNAPECFKGEPQPQENDGAYFVSCPEASGDFGIIYQFSRTPAGWKFDYFDNLH
jgi:hypothetical protein